MIGEVILLIALILAGAYSLLLILLLLGLFKVKRNAEEQGYTPFFVSVVVAARNEEENLPCCLESLLNQTYPKELCEVILVNDRSTDNTLSIAESFAEKHECLKTLSTTEHHSLTGKQRALDTGIRASSGKIILLTDADCEAPPRWIEDTVREFESDVGLVAGFALLKGDTDNQGILQRIMVESQSFELLINYAISIASMAQGVAWTCTGNNLAFRREVYDELGGFEALGFASTEDSMLIQWVDRHSKWQVKPMLNVIYTEPIGSISRFSAQRIRWIADSLRYRLSAVLFGAIAYGVNLFLLFLIVLCAFNVISYRWLIAFLCLKLVSEFLLALKGLALFNRIGLIKYFPLIQPFHVIYVVVFGIYCLSGKFTWKEREYRER